MTFEERLDAMELEIRKPIFRKNRGRANEVNYWVFDYPPEKELEVRARIERMQQKNATGNDDFKLVVFDLYDYIIDTLEKEGFLDQCYRFEDRRGIDRIVKAVGNLLCVNDDDSLIVRHIEENTPENAIVFLTGIGKCYPLLRSHKVLNNLSQSFGRVPVVLFFPGTYDEQYPVQYSPIAFRCSNHRKAISTRYLFIRKSMRWQQEHEWRFVEESIENKPEPIEIRNCIRAVYFGIGMDDSLKNYIEHQLIKRKILFYDMKMAITAKKRVENDNGNPNF